jgi:hypothetical protein
LTKLPAVKGITSYEFYKENEEIFNIFFLNIPSDDTKYTFIFAAEGATPFANNQTHYSWQRLIAF